MNHYKPTNHAINTSPKIGGEILPVNSANFRRGNLPRRFVAISATVPVQSAGISKSVTWLLGRLVRGMQQQVPLPPLLHKSMGKFRNIGLRQSCFYPIPYT